MRFPGLPRRPASRPASAAPAAPTDPSERPRLLLHAGSQKTGTTAIQYALSENRDRLRDQRVWYPAIADFFPMDPKLARARAHFAFANAVAEDNPKDNKRLARLLDAAAAQGSEIDRVILSAESLWRLTARATPDRGKETRLARRLRFLDRLAEVTAGFDTEVLLYLRRVDRYAASIYAESIVQTDKSWSFEDFLKSKDQRLGYRQKIDQFAAHFPVKVRNFEAAAAAGLVRSFCADAGIRDPLPDAPDRRRVSVSDRGLLWMRRAKLDNAGMPETERNRRWHFALRPENADLFAPDAPTSLWADRATRDAFIARHQAGVTEIVFPEATDAPAPLARWSDGQHNDTERRFVAWQRSNAATIRKRERARIPPYVLAP
ncbi:MAG: hypothetical protein KDK53_10825 [Maritimibacter sp.]|nr:hypothetical protein [Maritimibacter sp.]